jgi:hypothetical protein
MSASLFHELTNEALDAFWQLIVSRYPTAETGDLSPEATIRLQLAAEAAVKEWIMNNVLPQLTE